MSLSDAFRVIGSKPVIELLNLSTEIQFSTDVAYLSTHPVYLYWSMSSNKETEAYLGSWQVKDLGSWEVKHAWIWNKRKHYNFVTLTNFFQMLYLHLGLSMGY